MIFCPTCANLLITSKDTGNLIWTCQACPYVFPIDKIVSLLSSSLPRSPEFRRSPFLFLKEFEWRLTREEWGQVTDRTHLPMKQVDDVMGGKESWANVDKTDGSSSISSFLFLSVLSPSTSHLILIS